MSETPILVLAAVRERRGAPRARRPAAPRWERLSRALADLGAGIEGLLGPDRIRPPLVEELLRPGRRPRRQRFAPARRAASARRGHLVRVK